MLTTLPFPCLNKLNPFNFSTGIIFACFALCKHFNLLATNAWWGFTTTITTHPLISIYFAFHFWDSMNGSNLLPPRKLKHTLNWFISMSPLCCLWDVKRRLGSLVLGCICQETNGRKRWLAIKSKRGSADSLTIIVVVVKSPVKYYNLTVIINNDAV